jgi:AraC-like DNA-binding protein
MSPAKVHAMAHNLGDGIRYFHLPGWEGVELCLGEEVALPVPLQFNDWLEIRLILDGSATVSIGRTQHLVQRDTLVLIRPGELCAMDVADQVRVSFLSLCADPRLLRDADRAPAFAAADATPRPAVFVDPALRALLLAVRRAMTWAATGSTKQDLLRQLIAELGQCGVDGALSPPFGRAGALPPPIQRAIAFMRENSEISLSELATAAGLSKFHFLRLFAAHLGVTPHRYQLLLRVARARTLLRNGVEVVDAAFAAGFYDQSHLTRYFHSIVGVPPHRFQRYGLTPQRPG